MTTPIYDFITDYAASGAARLHMPGHKGASLLGCEALDLTEIAGTEGLIQQSEANAAALFGSGGSFYSAGGSSQCIRAMVYLALQNRPGAPILAARNVHRSFVSACALCGAEVLWLWPEKRDSLCACEISPKALEERLKSLPAPPAAVYVTSPDYLGGTADLPGLSAVCRRYDAPLLVDNAHGAYFKFLPESRHPLDLGADLCCDSAHKTLPVLTGGAYLHTAKSAPGSFRENARRALDFFGSTSPSWLILASLDRCNRVLAESYPARLWETVRALEALGAELRAGGWALRDSDPLRLTLAGDGLGIAARLRAGGVEPEYADRDFCVLMAAPGNAPGDFLRVKAALGSAGFPAPEPRALPLGKCETVLSPREALFAPRERVPVKEALGRICGAVTVSCPPAVPIAVSGERIGQEAVELFSYYGAETVEVLKEA